MRTFIFCDGLNNKHVEKLSLHTKTHRERDFNFLSVVLNAALYLLPYLRKCYNQKFSIE